MKGLDAFQREVLEKLVAVNTVNPPGNEAAAAEYLGGVLAELGFSVWMQELAPGRGSLIAQWGSEEGPVIALCGHLDVVAADAAHWDTDPFRLEERGSRLYGRGTADMKGAVSAMVAAARDFRQSCAAPFGKVMLLFVADEEVRSGGARLFVEKGGHPDALVIGEPTEMQVCVAHRGAVRYEIAVTGRSGHAAEPQNARNPLTAAGRFTLLMEDLNRELSGKIHPFLPAPTAAVTMLKGGEQPNSIPGSCRIMVDRRTIPGEGRETIVREVAGLRGRMPPEEAACIGEPEFLGGVGACEPLPGSTLGRDCQAVLSGMGVRAGIRSFPAGCDQHTFIRGGIDCVVVGPGSLSQAHTANEYIETDQLLLAREFYFKFLESKLK